MIEKMMTVINILQIRIIVIIFSKKLLVATLGNIPVFQKAGVKVS